MNSLTLTFYFKELIEPKNFIEHIIEDDIKNGFPPANLKFRFPPEPNGFLHIGHVKAICINFNLAKKYNAPIVLRFDDTNPEKEEQQYIDAIKKDISWLGFKWTEERFASDYFINLFNWAEELVKNNKAYVESQTSEKIAQQKGTPTQAGLNSPFRDRSVEENLDLFYQMKEGKHKEGAHVLRAKIDMSSPNMLMRDPVIYRVLKKSHPRTKNNWVVYPMYDWAHGESDYIEQISHSLCTLEFEPHRELYDWFLDQVVKTNKIRPKQREFARLNLSHTITSKRKLMHLVEGGHVSGWDDPRMPTISGLRRRGYTPASIIKFSEAIGVTKVNSLTDVSILESAIRDDLNSVAPRSMAVINPIKLVIENYPVDKVESIKAPNHPQNEEMGTREIFFSREIYIDREDFIEVSPNNKYKRLALNKEVRLRNSYIIKATHFDNDNDGNFKTIYCTYDPETLGKNPSDGRKVKGVIHFVEASRALEAEFRIYSHLFLESSPSKFDDFPSILNPDSLKIKNGFVESNLSAAKIEQAYQFEREGYYCRDNQLEDKLIFNKTVSLRDKYS